MHDSQDAAKIQESLHRFIEYAQSPDVYFRNLVGSTALETLPLVASSPKDVATVLELLSTVAVDHEIEVRCHVLEYIVHIALMLSDPIKSCETLRSFITSHILPIIVTALLDVDIKIVKLADCALIALLEHCLVPNGYVQERIWPAIVKKMYDHPLTDPIVRVIILMSKMVPWVGCDTTETLFVPLFVQLCSYPDIIPRKACASIVGDFCAVVSLNTVENKLVPSFLTLCGDSMWIVRKACAEVFTSVSSAASAYTRKHHLAPAFANLLTDPLNYVRSAAFHSLGPFITTFAEPSITNLGYNHQGKLVLRHPDGFEFQLNANIELNITERQSISESPVNNSTYGYGCYDDEEDEEDEVKNELVESGEHRDNESSSSTPNNTTADNRESEGTIREQDNRDADLNQTKIHHARRNLFNSSVTYSDKESIIDVSKNETLGGEIDKNISGGKDFENYINNEDKEKCEKNWQEEENSCNNDKSDVHNISGEICKEEESVSEKKLLSSIQVENKQNDEFTEKTDLKLIDDRVLNQDNQISIEDTSDLKEDKNKQEVKEEKSTSKTEETHDEKNFNGFVFWRDPIPDIEIDPKLGGEESNAALADRLLDLLKKQATANVEPRKYTYSQVCKKKMYKVSGETVKHGKGSNVNNFSDSSWADFTSESFKPPYTSDNVSPTEKYDFTKQKNQLFLAFIQHIEASSFIGAGNGSDYNDDRGASVVPDELINHFVSMSSPRQEDKMQNELAHHCAYNLPAVALTLGPENWALIKQACNSLATDQQWRVRRIVASSIHELAVIVGSEVATEDLVPVFTGFIKDLDEVRIGALKHLANFLKLLKPTVRNSLLPRLAEFLITDYEWNWRFRAELAEQLLQIVRLFSPEDISIHLAPVAFTLLQDKVAHVRKIAVQLVVEMVSVISKEGVLVRSAVAELAEQFAHSSRWCRRQTFAHLCSSLVEQKALPLDMFARDILPHLLDLSWDKVPNVRLSVARTLSQHIMALDTFSNPSSPHHEVVFIVIKRLQTDRDRDVRYFAALSPHSTSEPKYSRLSDLSSHSTSEPKYVSISALSSLSTSEPEYVSISALSSHSTSEPEYTSAQLPESSKIDSNRLNEEDDLPR